ncbi:MAG: hypothetical protein M1409_04330, partial [Actinobacteria bacterium]|nr:hypothetical protein [Actinomycetota bacterium]
MVELVKNELHKNISNGITQNSTPEIKRFEDVKKYFDDNVKYIVESKYNGRLIKASLIKDNDITKAVIDYMSYYNGKEAVSLELFEITSDFAVNLKIDPLGIDIT